jgi:hypothetical protein
MNNTQDAATSTLTMAEYVAQVVAQAPPLTAEQITLIDRIIRRGGR